MQIVLTMFVALAVMWPAWSNNLQFADDAHLAYESRKFGFWGPTRAFVQLWGFYRIGYVILLSPVYALTEHLWVIKLIGVLLHAGTAILALSLWRRLRGGRLSGAVVLTSIVLYPFALEAVVWPATVAEYAFGPFVLLLGALVATGSRPRSALYGGTLMGVSLLLHEQLLVPLLVLGFILLRHSKRDSKGLVIGVSITAGLAAILVLLSFTQNTRLSGPAGPSLGHVLDHLPYIIVELRRSTPFGDFFWNTSGFRVPRTYVVAALGAVLAMLWVSVREPRENSRGFTFPLWAIGLAGLAWLGTVLPIISSGVPWHTPRVMYIPAIAMAFLLGGMVEAISRIARSASTRRLIAGLIVAWAVWGAVSLGAEADAFLQQLEINDARLDALVSAIEPSRDLTDTSLLVVAGFPGTDVPRPFFGEHMIGITSGELRARLGFRVYQPSSKPSFDFRSGWVGLCRQADGRLDLLPEWIDTNGLSVPEDGASYLVWLDGAWQVQRGSETPPPFEKLEPLLPECSNE